MSAKVDQKIPQKDAGFLKIFKHFTNMKCDLNSISNIKEVLNFQFFQRLCSLIDVTAFFVKILSGPGKLPTLDFATSTNKISTVQGQ